MGLFKKIKKIATRVVDPLDITGLQGQQAVKDATKAQLASANSALDLQRAIYQDQQAQQAPFREAGLTAQNQLLNYLGLSNNVNAPGYGKYARDFGMDDFKADPGYQFRLSEGLKALDRQAAARGGLISGAALKAAGRYGQDMASNEYQNAFNRYQVNRSNQLNSLQSLMGAGQTATNMLGDYGQNYANQGSNLYTDMGNTRASQYIGSYGAQMGGINRLMDLGGLLLGGRR